MLIEATVSSCRPQPSSPLERLGGESVSIAVMQQLRIAAANTDVALVRADCRLTYAQHRQKMLLEHIPITQKTIQNKKRA